jgi:amino acid adenylation domain-containing protein
MTKECFIGGRVNATSYSSSSQPTDGQPLSSDQRVPEVVERLACQDSHRTAVVAGAMELTYGELNQQANQLAHRLQALGVRPEVRVGVCMPRSPLSVVALLAVMKAGGGYVPLDPSYPSDRISFILKDADVPVLLTNPEIAQSLPQGAWQSLAIDGATQDLANYPTDPPTTNARPEHLAYAIYTSGSTGTPKGVQVTHESLLNLVCWHQKAFAVTQEDRATQLASVGFDASVWELWPHLTAGATVCITPEEARNSPELLRDWLVTQKITISFVPTALAERLILLDWPPNTKLRLLLTGADTLHHYPRPGLPFQLINNYGPTETTVVATSGPIPPTSHPDGRPPIGRPIDNTQVYICDESLNQVPNGEVGELYIGGAGVARGYVNSPELTAKKFVRDPFSHKCGARLFRTGDLARLLPDGQLAYVRRADDLIKVRGYRIEPNEIITVLNTHPAVHASAVVARADGSGSLRLVAYVVTNDHHRPTSGELRNLLHQHLPDYMLPATYISLQALPLTPNGKTDYDALPLPDNTNTLTDEDSVAPRTPLEEKLSAIVASLLNMERVSVNDNFFLIGGHSLLGTQLIARIQESFGVELPLRSVFDSPTVAQLGRETERLIVAKIDSMSEDEVQLALQHISSVRDPQ